MSMQRTIVERDPKKLTPHTLNAELFSDLTTDDYNNLKEDIAARGIQDPLHITTGNVIISGHQRQKVALELDIPVPCIIREDLTEDWQVEEQLIADNLLRRHLTDFQKMECGERLRYIESVKAKERQKELAGTRPNKEPDLKENLPEGNKGQTRDKYGGKAMINIANAEITFSDTKETKAFDIIRMTEKSCWIYTRKNDIERWFHANRVFEVRREAACKEQ